MFLVRADAKSCVELCVGCRVPVCGGTSGHTCSYKARTVTGEARPSEGLLLPAPAECGTHTCCSRLLQQVRLAKFQVTLAVLRRVEGDRREALVRSRGPYTAIHPAHSSSIYFDQLIYLWKDLGLYLPVSSDSRSHRPFGKALNRQGMGQHESAVKATL